MCHHNYDLTTFVKILLITPIIIFQTSCKQGGITGTEIIFNESENEGAEQVTRMIVTKKYLRIDDGKTSNDFLLFDRTKRIIYSTNSLDQRTLVITSQPLNTKSPVKLEDSIKIIPTDAPDIEGKNVTRVQLSTNNNLCYDLFAVKGFLTDAVAALKEYRSALAGEQAVIVNEMPKETLQPCDLADNIFNSTRHLEYGFPVRLKETNGRFRELVDYKKEIKIDAALLKLPENYKHFTTEEMRGSGK